MDIQTYIIAATTTVIVVLIVSIVVLIYHCAISHKEKSIINQRVVDAKDAEIKRLNDKIVDLLTKQS